MSPVETRVPFTTRSGLMSEAAERATRGCGGATGAGAAGASFLLVNMSAGLDERARVTHHVVVPDLVVDVRPRASTRRSQPADRGPLRNVCSDLHEYGRQMAVTGVDSEAVIDFHHIAVAAALSGKNHGARSRRFDQ